MTAIGTPYKQATLDEQWDAIVIESGIGGLTAAVLLAEHGGKRVLVLERHYEAGGFTHTFRRPGYQWDVGVHYIGEMQDESSAARRAFDHITGGDVRWQPMPEIYDRIIVGDRSYDFVAGLEQFRSGMNQRFPAESKTIDRYIAAVQASNRASRLYYAEKAIPAPLAKLAGGLMRAPYMRWTSQTTRDVLESMTGNRELIGVLTAQWGDYGLPPAKSSFAVHATIAQHYFEGGSYPVGGAGTIAAAIAPRIEGNGGRLVTSAEVAGILLERGKAAGVRMVDGREFRSGLVVSDAGAVNTFARLLPANLPALDTLRAKLHAIPPSSAHLSLYLGLGKSDAELGLTGTNLWIYPSLDHDANVEQFAHDMESPFPLVYLSFPSAKDLDFQRRHPGNSTIEAVVPVPFAPFARWADTSWKRRGGQYEALKKQLTVRLLEVLRRQVPSTAGNINCLELSTPISTRHFMNYRHGEIYGFSATPQRFALREVGARTPIRGLYLTGQDVTTLGVVGALFGGVASASVALGKNLFSAMAKPFTARG